MDIVIAILGSTALSSVLVKLIDAWLERRKRKDSKEDTTKSQEKAIARLSETAEEHTNQLNSLQSGVMLLLFDRFEALATKYIEQGEISLRQLEVLTSFANAYISLGGDGWCQTLMERVNELPVK